MRLSKRQARRAALTGQLLAGRRPTSLVDVVEHVGRLQIDPVNAIARAERMVLWSRLGNYDVADLHKAVYTDRHLFEYLAFYLPVRDYVLYRPAMRAWPQGRGVEADRTREFLRENADFRTYLLTELDRRGPLRSRDLEDRARHPWRSGGWNDHKSLSRMLEFLMCRGDIAVADRHGNERVWTLGDGWYPDVPDLPDRERTRRLIVQQLRSRGVARPNQFAWMFFTERPPDWAAVLADLVREGVAVPVEIDGLTGEWYADAATLEAPFAGRTTLLSPFDRLINLRDRAEQLFDFHYRLEMYVPRARREYGYYVLPILDGDRLVGRVDAAFDRRRDVLAVNGVFAEDGAPAAAGRRLAAALTDLGRWLGAGRIDVADRVPASWAGALRRL